VGVAAQVAPWSEKCNKGGWAGRANGAGLAYCFGCSECRLDPLPVGGQVLQGEPTEHDVAHSGKPTGELGCEGKPCGSECIVGVNAVWNNQYQTGVTPPGTEVPKTGTRGACNNLGVCTLVPAAAASSPERTLAALCPAPKSVQQQEAQARAE
jgi:hypothetical protein